MHKFVLIYIINHVFNLSMGLSPFGVKFEDILLEEIEFSFSSSDH